MVEFPNIAVLWDVMTVFPKCPAELCQVLDCYSKDQSIHFLGVIGDWQSTSSDLFRKEGFILFERPSSFDDLIRSFLDFTTVLSREFSVIWVFVTSDPRFLPIVNQLLKQGISVSVVGQPTRENRSLATLKNFVPLKRLKKVTPARSQVDPRKFGLPNPQINKSRLSRQLLSSWAMAHFYQHHARYKEALTYYHEALNLAYRLNHSTNKANIHGRIGVLLASQQQLDRALEHFHKALTLTNYEPNAEQTKFALIKSIGEIYETQGRLNEAETKYHEAFVLLKYLPESQYKNGELMEHFVRIKEKNQQAKLKQQAQIKQQYALISKSLGQERQTSLRQDVNKDEMKSLNRKQPQNDFKKLVGQFLNVPVDNLSYYSVKRALDTRYNPKMYKVRNEQVKKLLIDLDQTIRPKEFWKLVCGA